jgi:DNA-directed RNA polymerase specialized sigma subunit
MTDTELIQAYDGAISKIAKTVSGANLDILDDLIQVGRIAFLATYPKNQKWCYLSQAIKRQMLDYKYDDKTVRIPERSARRHNLTSVSVEVPEELSTRDKDTSAIPVMSALLEEIEAKVETLPPRDKRKAQRYLEHLESGKKSHTDMKAGKRIVDGLITSLRTQYDSLGLVSA